MSMFDYKPPGRLYHCDIYNEDYYFKYCSPYEGEFVIGKEIVKLYKEDSDYALYVYLCSESDGTQKWPDYKDKKEYQKQINKFKKVVRFADHYQNWLKWYNGVGDDDQLKSDMEGTIENRKKQS